MSAKCSGECIIKLRELHSSGGGAEGDESEADRKPGPTGSRLERKAAMLSEGKDYVVSCSINSRNSGNVVILIKSL